MPSCGLSGTASRLVFEMLEQFRVESLVPADVARRAAQPRRRDSAAGRGCSRRRNSVETDSGLLLYTVAQVCRSWITAEPIADWTQDLIEGTRFELASAIGRELPLLRRNRHSPERVRELARAIAERVANLPQLQTEPGEPDTGWDAFEWLFDSESDDDTAPPSCLAAPRTRWHGESAGYRVFSQRL